MKHKSFSIPVPSWEEGKIESRPLLSRFDRELEVSGYRTITSGIISDKPTNLPGNAYIRSTKSSSTLVSDKAYLQFTTNQLIQRDKGETYHTATITGNISMCEEKDLEDFKKLVKSAFNTELELNDMQKENEKSPF